MKRSGFLPRTTGLKPSKPMRKVSKKKATYRASKEGREDLAYMGEVKKLPCVVCGAPGPSDAHHCQDKPPKDMGWIYEQMPAAGRKSGARDTIPLCKWDHQDGPEAYHRGKKSWRAKHGNDYDYIKQTREAVRARSQGSDDAEGL